MAAARGAAGGRELRLRPASSSSTTAMPTTSTRAQNADVANSVIITVAFDVFLVDFFTGAPSPGRGGATERPRLLASDVWVLLDQPGRYSARPPPRSVRRRPSARRRDEGELRRYERPSPPAPRPRWSATVAATRAICARAHRPRRENAGYRAVMRSQRHGDHDAAESATPADPHLFVVAARHWSARPDAMIERLAARRRPTR